MWAEETEYDAQTQDFFFLAALDFECEDRFAAFRALRVGDRGTWKETDQGFELQAERSGATLHFRREEVRVFLPERAEA